LDPLVLEITTGVVDRSDDLTRKLTFGEVGQIFRVVTAEKKGKLRTLFDSLDFRREKKVTFYSLLTLINRHFPMFPTLSQSRPREASWMPS
jgi:hypothetical protein